MGDQHATIAARAEYAIPLDGESVGVFVTLVVGMLGCLVGARLRKYRPLDASPTQGSASVEFLDTERHRMHMRE